MSGISPAEEALTEDLAQVHIKCCREITCAFAGRVFPEFWQAWSQLLAQKAANNEQAKRREGHKLTNSQRQSAERNFCQMIGANFLKFAEGTLVAESNHTAAPAPTGATLSLVDPGNLEESIAIDSMLSRADVTLAEPLWALNQRFALLNRGHKVEEQGNPASPLQFCEALRKLFAGEDLDMRLRIAGYKLFERWVVQRLDELYTDLHAYLVANKLLPNLRYRMPGGDTPDPESNQSGMLGAIRQLQNHLGGSAANEDSAALLTETDRHNIDLVGMLFEFMLVDDNLPDKVKTLLSYLHAPFLKIAYIDQTFLERDDHPARVLLNSLAEAGSRWVSSDGDSPYNIYSKIKTTVCRLREEFDSDLGLLDELVNDFQEYTAGATRWQTMVERRALEKMQGEETLREAKILVNTEVQNRIAGKDLPSAILLLLLQPWSDYLSFVLLRYSHDSEHWTQALFVMDELLWSVEPKELQVDKERLEKYRGTLILALEAAFETIGYDQTRGRTLLDSVMSLQDLALKSCRGEPAPRTMRTRLESMVEEKAGTNAELNPPTPEEADMMDKLTLIEFGTWLEMQGGRRIKVAWYSRTTLNYMLVDRLTNKVSVTTGLQLAQQMIAGELRIITGSAKPFFERALENIYHKLKARAKALQED